MASSDHDVSDVSQQLARLTDVAYTIERRLLRLVTEGAQQAISPEDIVGELGLLAEDVKRCYARLWEMRDRRDVGFKTEERLEELDHHCVWLYRRIHLERCFFWKWQLETKLRSLISPEAFAVYQEILDVEHLERQCLMRGSAEVSRLMLEAGEVSPERTTSLLRQPSESVRIP